MVTPTKKTLKAKRMLKLSVLTKAGVLVQDEIGNIKSLHQESQRAESTQALQWCETAGTGSAGTKAPAALEETEGLQQPSQATSQRSKREASTAEGDSVKRECTGADNSDALCYSSLCHPPPNTPVAMPRSETGTKSLTRQGEKLSAPLRSGQQQFKQLTGTSGSQFHFKLEAEISAHMGELSGSKLPLAESITWGRSPH